MILPVITPGSHPMGRSQIALRVQASSKMLPKSWSFDLSDDTDDLLVSSYKLILLGSILISVLASYSAFFTPRDEPSALSSISPHLKLSILKEFCNVHVHV